MAELKRRLDGLDAARPTTCAASSTTWCAAASGSSAATAGPTTSAPAASTTCWPAGANVNVLVLDTEVYSNTGGQMSKATPLGAVAKFAAAGKTDRRRRTSPCRRSPTATSTSPGSRWAPTRSRPCSAFREAEAYDGPSLVIAYSHCIAHGIEMRDGLDQQYRAVASGYWPLIRYDPMVRAAGGNPFLLDSPRPRMPLTDYTQRELRYRELAQHPPGRGGEAGQPGPGGGRPALGDLRGDGDPRRRTGFRPTPRRDR